MKRPFDTIVGPDGVWKDDGAAEEKHAQEDSSAAGKAHAADGDGERTLLDLDAREEFVLRCLNAAANLYGVITAEEFVLLYNGYAKDHDAPISDPLTGDELDRLTNFFFDCPSPDSETFADIALEPDIWFATSVRKDGTTAVISYRDLIEPAPVDASESPRKTGQSATERKRLVMKRLQELIASFRQIPIIVLPEEDFLCYEDPMCAEETKESRAFAKFIKKEYHIEKDMAEMDVMSIQSRIRTEGSKIVYALEYIRDYCDWEPSDHDAFMRLVNAVSPLVSATRTWEGRGRTSQELCRMGLVPKFEKEHIYDVFGLDDGDGRPSRPGRDDADDWDDDFDSDDGDDEGDFIQPEDIPVSVYNGPIDFKFVKDAARRDAKLAIYEDVRQVTMDFVRRRVMREQTQEERRQAAVRLGFLKEGDPLSDLDPALDCVVGDFASMMDDQGDGPAIRRVLARKDELDEIDRRSATYYENYRYTWLEILAMKAGVGLKCRDLMTGEELFLMEKSLSRCVEKGMTICAGIAPMEDVYIDVGVSAPARFENPATILKIVLTHLGLPTELPIRLSVADQARFAAETIRRIHANGNFNFVIYEA